MDSPFSDIISSITNIADRISDMSDEYMISCPYDYELHAVARQLSEELLVVFKKQHDLEHQVAVLKEELAGVAIAEIKKAIQAL